MRELISEYLLESNLRVSTAEGGADMTRVLTDHVIDLVLLDLRLEGEDGMDLARRLHEETDVPVIIVTGRRDEADRVMGLEIAADDYVTKPFSNRELLARVRAVLRRYQRKQASSEPARGTRRRGYRLRRLGVQRPGAPPDRSAGPARRAQQRRVQSAGGLLRGAATCAFPRPADGPVTVARRRDLRPLHRRADLQAAPQDRRRRRVAEAHPEPSAVPVISSRRQSKS